MSVQPCVHDGHVTNVRYRDAATLLRKQTYDQVLMVDGGDIIFQADISHLFSGSSDRMRAVCDERKYSLHAVLPILRDFQPDQRQAISRRLHDRPQINGGFVLGPAAGFLRLWAEFQSLTRSMSQFAADQILLNDVLHREGFDELPSRYNFVLVAARSKFSVRDGRFYDAAGALIPVVHNAGHMPFFRRISRFGYGSDRNRVKTSSHVAVRVLFTGVDFWSRLTGGGR
jgi:lipopolysaccharide biosynthesis glycosyltransferase